MLGLTWGQNLGEGQLEGINIIKTPPDRRTPRTSAIGYWITSWPTLRRFMMPASAELKIGELRNRLEELKKTLPPLGRVPGVMQAVEPRATYVHVRSDFRRHGDEVPAALPAFAAAQAADRLALARWLVAPSSR